MAKRSDNIDVIIEKDHTHKLTSGRSLDFKASPKPLTVAAEIGKALIAKKVAKPATS